MSERLREPQIWKESYNEVLLFLKHQDDKINRVLTALAFLTAAAVALYVFGRGEPHAADFPPFSGTSLTADDYFFGAFLIGLFFAVAIALVALDPTSAVPKYLASEDPTSIVFYHAIAHQSAGDWHRLRGGDAEESLTASFHGDARRLSHRAIHKVTRFGQATAFVQFTVASFVLLGIMRLNHVEHQHARWRVASFVLIAYAALPVVEFLYQRATNFPGVGKDYVKQERWWLGPSMFFAPYLLVTTASLAVAPDHWEPVTFALVGTLLLRLIAHETPPWARWFGVQAALLLTVCEVPSFWLT
jgi:hypothetical protein